MYYCHFLGRSRLAVQSTSLLVSIETRANWLYWMSNCITNQMNDNYHSVLKSLCSLASSCWYDATGYDAVTEALVETSASVTASYPVASYQQLDANEHSDFRTEW